MGAPKGGLRPLSAICAQSSTSVHFRGPLRPLSKGNFRRKMATIVGNRGQLWTSTLSPHLLSPHLDFPDQMPVSTLVGVVVGTLRTHQHRQMQLPWTLSWAFSLCLHEHFCGRVRGVKFRFHLLCVAPKGISVILSCRFSTPTLR